MAKYALIFKHAKGAKNPMLYEVVEYQNKKLAKEDIKLNGFVAVTVLSMDDLKTLMSLDFTNLDNKIKLCKTFGMTFNDDNYERATQFLFDVLAYDSTIFIETSDTCKEIKEELNQNGVIITDSKKEGAYIYYRVQNEQNGEYFSLTYNQIRQTIETGVHGTYEELPLKEFFHKLATRTQEETQAPTVTLSSDDIKQIKELMHDLGTDLDGICELSNNVSISSNCLDESHYTSTLTLSNEDYAFTFNVHTGVLESVTNCDTMEYETLDNYLIESFEDIIKAIRRAHKAHEEEKAHKYYIKACHPYVKAFEKYTIFNKKELQKDIINWACVYQKALLCAEHSGLVNKNYSKDMFIKSLKEATQKISHDIVGKNKPQEDFIKNQTQFLALQTLECYYSDVCFGFGLMENDVKNAIKKVKLESVAI